MWVYPRILGNVIWHSALTALTMEAHESFEPLILGSVVQFCPHSHAMEYQVSSMLTGQAPGNSEQRSLNLCPPSPFHRDL